MQRVMEGMEVEEFPEPVYVDGDAPDGRPRVHPAAVPDVDAQADPVADRDRRRARPRPRPRRRRRPRPRRRCRRRPRRPRSRRRRSRPPRCPTDPRADHPGPDHPDHAAAVARRRPRRRRRPGPATGGARRTPGPERAGRTRGRHPAGRTRSSRRCPRWSAGRWVTTRQVTAGGPLRGSSSARPPSRWPRAWSARPPASRRGGARTSSRSASSAGPSSPAPRRPPARHRTSPPGSSASSACSPARAPSRPPPRWRCCWPCSPCWPPHCSCGWTPADRGPRPAGRSARCSSPTGSRGSSSPRWASRCCSWGWTSGRPWLAGVGAGIGAAFALPVAVAFVGVIAIGGRTRDRVDALLSAAAAYVVITLPGRARSEGVDTGSVWQLLDQGGIDASTTTRAVVQLVVLAAAAAAVAWMVRRAGATHAADERAGRGW